MDEIWRRFSPFEKALLIAAALAGGAAVGDLVRGDGRGSVVLCLIVAGACIGAAGGSRKRRLLGERRQLGPLERVERSHPVLFVTVSGVILGALFASADGPGLGIAFAAIWIGSQLAVMRPRVAARELRTRLERGGGY
jgi:hypothetical protein